MIEQLALFGDGNCGATFSEDRVYRYLLWRRWGEGPKVLWIMLNPSTANEMDNDPTVRRCISFSQRWGFGGLEVANLFAFRATEPADLFKNGSPVGPDNNKILEMAHRHSNLTVAAWGAFGVRHQRSNWPREHLLPIKTMACLGKTAGGEPKHPLYLSHKTQLRPMEKRDE